MGLEGLLETSRQQLSRRPVRSLDQGEEIGRTGVQPPGTLVPSRCQSWHAETSAGHRKRVGHGPDEFVLDVEQPDVIAPAVGVDLDVVSAAVITAGRSARRGGPWRAVRREAVFIGSG
jgi:hypothetical protein